MTEILLDSLLPIFVVMALGYLAGWTRDIDNNHLAALNALVMDFAPPLSLFVATASTPRALLLAQWPLLVVCRCWCCTRSHTGRSAAGSGWDLVVPEETGRHPGYQIEGNGTGYFLKRGDGRCRL